MLGPGQFLFDKSMGKRYTQGHGHIMPIECAHHIPKSWLSCQYLMKNVIKSGMKNQRGVRSQ